jgi:hypothetical protein
MSLEIHNLITSAKTVGMLQHDEEIISLSTFVAALQPKRIMEIGSWKGGVFKILSSIAKELAISVDLDAYGDLPGTMEERNAMFRSWGGHIHPLVGDFHSMGTYRAVHSLVGDQQLDFAHGVGIAGRVVLRVVLVVVPGVFTDDIRQPLQRVRRVLGHPRQAHSHR